MKWMKFNKEDNTLETTIQKMEPKDGTKRWNQKMEPKDISAFLYAIDYIHKCHENLTTEELNTSDQIRRIELSFQEVLQDNSKLNEVIDNKFGNILIK